MQRIDARTTSTRLFTITTGRERSPITAAFDYVTRVVSRDPVLTYEPPITHVETWTSARCADIASAHHDLNLAILDLEIARACIARRDARTPQEWT